MPLQVPFNDLQLHHRDLRDRFHQSLDELLDSSAYIGGKALKTFENDFANFCNQAHCVGVGNGTDALIAALKSLGIGPGDIVITVPNTFIATTEAITEIGAKIEFVDIDPQDRTLCPKALEAHLKAHQNLDQVKAVIPVHLHGQPCDMKAIQTLCQNHDLKVIADSAQAHGAYIDGQSICQYADLSTYSFYPGKNMGALGDGGAVVTQNKDLADFMHSWCNHGRHEKYTHFMEGINSRLDALQALFLIEKIKVAPEKTKARQRIAKQLIEALQGLPIELPQYHENRISVFHIFAITTTSGEALAQHLKDQNIQTGVHYPIPLHLQKAYEYLNLQEGCFPIAEKFCRETLSLPLFPEMNEEQVEHLIQQVKAFFEKA